jgi:beta-lactamase regulating signal transducer with metallopeptidase domain
METVGLNHTAVLYALGWAIAHSLWQMGLLWLIYQLFLGLPKNVKPAYRYGAAVLFVASGFVWFTITFTDQFYTYQSINRYIEQLPVADGEMLSPEIHAAGASGEIINRIFSVFERFIPYLSAGYLAVLIFLFVRLINAYGYTQKIRTRGLVPAGEFWDDQLLQFTRKLGLSENIKVYLTALIDVPATIGFFKPVILLPIATINHLSTEQVESIILHELAHIRRQDYLLNIFISILETILFFNPFAYLLVNVVKKERELFCDDFVVAFKNDPHNYATALLHLEKLRKGTTALLAVAATGHDGVLLNRVKRIMKVNAQPFQYREKLIALFFISGLLSTLAWLDPVPSSPTHPLTAKAKIADGITAQPLTIQDLIIKSEGNIANAEKTATKKTIAAKLIETKADVNFAPLAMEVKPLERFDLQTTFNETYINDHPSGTFGNVAPLSAFKENSELPPFAFDVLPLKKYAPYPVQEDSVNVLQLFKTTTPDRDNEFNQLIEKALQLSAAQKPVPFELLSRIEQLNGLRFSFHYNEQNRRMKERVSGFAAEAPQPSDMVYFNEPPTHPNERVNLASREYRKVTRSNNPVQRAKGQSFVIIDDQLLIKGEHLDDDNTVRKSTREKRVSGASDFYIGDEMRQSFGGSAVTGWGVNMDSSFDRMRLARPTKRKSNVAIALTPSANGELFITDNIQGPKNIRSTSPAKVIAGTKKVSSGKANAAQKITISIETSNELISIEFDQDEQEE